MGYKISGSITHNSRIKIFQGAVYKGYKDVTAGSYSVVFDAPNNDSITASVEKSDGQSLSFGNIIAEPTGDAVDILLYPTETFTSNGTWTRPEGVEQVIVIIAGPGGGGGGFGGVGEGSNGGSGGACKTEIVDVSLVSSVDIVIGIGGGGGGEDANGANGSEPSTFGGYISAAVGKFGHTNGTVANAVSQALDDVGSGMAGGAAAKGYPGAYGAGGAGQGGTKGAGGGGSYGKGGAGGDGGGGANGTNGGGGGGADQASGNGGDGGDGICIVIPIVQDITLP